MSWGWRARDSETVGLVGDTGSGVREVPAKTLSPEKILSCEQPWATKKRQEEPRQANCHSRGTKATQSRSHCQETSQGLLAICFLAFYFYCFHWNGILWRHFPTWLQTGAQRQRHFCRIGRDHAAEYFRNSKAKRVRQTTPPSQNAF
ncbi:hypothetical protein LEMLEM_LOCUS21737 [Lemmus lemmus]